ncbi:CPL6 [Auxenochlorella protothecoides x Auxenochlorella symbiontica]
MHALDSINVMSLDLRCSRPDIRHRAVVPSTPLCRAPRHLRRRPCVHCANETPSSSGHNGKETDSGQGSSVSTENFSIIESRDSVKSFEGMHFDDIYANITARRNRIFLLMEEVRRLRIQLRAKGGTESKEALLESETYPSSIPLFPAISDETLKRYWRYYFTAVAGIISFGALLAPTLELRLGLGGTTYRDFIASLHLPNQLADVDPIVASFCGGAVGVLSALLLVEINNAKVHNKQRCLYCEGTGYLACGACEGAGSNTKVAGGGACAICAGTGKVMCTSCLCTGKKLATEHDPRIDPFNPF